MSNQIQSLMFSENFIVLVFFAKKLRLLSGYQFIIVVFVLGLNLIVSALTKDKFVLPLLLIYVILELLFMVKYTNNWLIPTIYMVYQLFVVMVIRMVTITLPMLLFEHHISVFVLLWILVIQTLLICGCYMAMVKLNERLKFWEFLNYQVSKYKCISIIVLIALFSISIIYVLSSIGEKWLLSSYFLLILVFLCVSLFFVLSYSKRNVEQREYLNSIANYYTQEHIRYNSLRAFKHDFKDLAIGLTACLEDEDYDEAKVLLNEIIESSKNVITESMYAKLTNIRNTSLRGLFIHYCNRCIDNEIDLEMDILASFEINDAELVDVIRCLSILLNNAEEETVSLTQHCKKIWIEIGNTDNGVVFMIKNHRENDIDSKSISNRGYTTKVGHNGIGLNTIKSIEKDNKNIQVNLKICKGFFSAELYILT